MSKYQVVMFDLDNTLLKTEQASIAALTQALNEDGVKVKASAIRKLMGIPGLEMAKRLGSFEPTKTINRFNQLIGKKVDLIETYDGIKQMITALGDSSLEFGIVTSKLKEVYDAEMPHFPEINAIKKVVYSDDTKEHKPNPEPIEFALENKFDHISVNNALYVGDSLFDMQAAHAAHVDFANAHWGALPNDDFSDAEYILNHPSELLKIVND
ncbi:HAD family hydrolase [Pediococcus claussenii]|uniref:HAD hydrolase, IA, variant 1 family protein n=1 Tax=Pediococcus claussenii (strain ATCC BAA-344 / DSM 14800 / JCM 18046 / KCTC 3811 / LMG 21948 / P06) TaxID=701521 RepID=G8PA87_PEDCP|nr:HAD family hydrolase [Pediococcus claussenii]AEV94526.1 HAD hydrolase, IA, variant 1 family protein [Pediococcus claussenii ATCC BAA-344]ANZ69743.1 phosphoglycolate phosphatase [Pediococcus claussenii]ANZ71560.1 phosphoglycolate phosphatase [Pediococcus claussenii]KRN19767.1 hypothetical protein IV79_GL001055 [Pediococcus claussenii]